jgi:universal stress protein F
MYRNILVPVALDHERDVATALAVARSLVADGGSITALTVVEAVPAYILAEFPKAMSNATATPRPRRSRTRSAART